VGKSLLTTALCRLFARTGVRVVPFKSQNIALNAAVTFEGGEIGRAQAVQAEAAGVEATVDMNPILLKPEADDRSQVIVRGKVIGSLRLGDYRARAPEFLGIAVESLERLRSDADLVLIEGAGSPAEVNLLEDDIVNMRIARLADAPVLLVGDIDRGGVFAALVGTLELLEPADRARVRGLVVNRFRGDPEVLAPGLDVLTSRTGVPVLGVIPHLLDVRLPAEDSLDLERSSLDASRGLLEIAVPRVPHLANFDDLDPLAHEPGVRVRWVTTPAGIHGADAIVLAGSKATVADLRWLRARGLEQAIVAAARAGVPVLGLCGGFQMLGTRIDDPSGVESASPSVEGLGLLPVVTRFEPGKLTVRVRARVAVDAGPLADAAGTELEAYEIHAGRTEIPAELPHLFEILARGGRPSAERDGAFGHHGNVLGTYLHGVLAASRVRRALLGFVARRAGRTPDPAWGRESDQASVYDRLADAVGAALDMKRIAGLVGLAAPK